jgi:hypothetical protein
MEGSSWVPLKWLDRRFTQPTSRDDIIRAYVQARLVVAALLKDHGVGNFKQFLGGLAAAQPIDAAYERAFAPDRWAATDTNFVKPAAQ